MTPRPRLPCPQPGEVVITLGVSPALTPTLVVEVGPTAAQVSDAGPSPTWRWYDVILPDGKTMMCFL